MLRVSLHFLLTAVPMLLFFTSSQAAATFLPGPIMPGMTFQVLDGTNDYALRLDGLGGNPDDVFTFSAERGGADLTITQRESLRDIRIQGTVYGGLGGPGSSGSQLWEIDVLYETISVIDDILVAGIGNGKITALGGDGLPTGNFAFFQGEAVGGRVLEIELLANGTIVGEGLLRHDQLGRRVDTQEWNFRVGNKVAVVPEPGTALLLGTGLIALGARRRTHA